MYCISADIVLVNSCWMPKLKLRISGLCRFVAIGRTRPHLGGHAADPVKSAGFGALGNAAKTAGFVVVTVFKVVPSKFSESRTTLLKASWVVSANEALNSVFSQGAKVKPSRGW